MKGKHEPAHRSLDATLRPLRRTDTEAIATAMTDPVLRRWLRPSPDYPERLYARVQRRRAQSLGDVRVITVADQFAGLVSVALRMTEPIREGPQGVQPPHPRSLRGGHAPTTVPLLYGEIGYWVTEQFRGHGVARVAVGSFTQETLLDHRVDWLQATIPVGNGPSRTVATACGYAEVGIVTADWRIPDQLGQLGQSWLMRRDRHLASLEC